MVERPQVTKKTTMDVPDQKQRAAVNEHALRLCGLAARRCDVELERVVSVVDMYDETGPFALLTINQPVETDEARTLLTSAVTVAVNEFVPQLQHVKVHIPSRNPLRSQAATHLTSFDANKYYVDDVLTQAATMTLRTALHEAALHLPWTDAPVMKQRAMAAVPPKELLVAVCYREEFQTMLRSLVDLSLPPIYRVMASGARKEVVDDVLKDGGDEPKTLMELYERLYKIGSERWSASSAALIGNVFCEK